jgi:hypothetical protein
MKRICAITMARNDDFFLEKWINYYGAELGEENLFVFLDGNDQNIPSNAGKTNITICEHVPQRRTVGDKTRISRLSEFAGELLNKYDLVIGTDTDEFLIVDPRCEKSLTEYLSEVNCSTSVSGLGIDVGQKLGVEEKIDTRYSLLSQREYAVISSRYTKPVVISRPVSWGAGFHRIKKHNFRIDKNLYLFHLGYFDLEMIQQKSLDKDRIDTGWNKHLKKRAETISFVTRKIALNGDTFLPIARIVQTLLRPVYAWNKPSMGWWKLVIKIPDRFKTIRIC